MDKRTLALLGVLLVVIAVTAAVATRALSSPGSGSSGSGAAAPPIQGTTLQGKPFDLAQTIGKPTVINFFASWCPPCNQEAPDLVAFATAHPDVRVIGVATNDAKADTQRFVTEYQLPYTVVMDPSGTIAGAWGVTGIPATFFLDRNGAQRASMVGAATRAQFEEKLKSIK